MGMFSQPEKNLLLFVLIFPMAGFVLTAPKETPICYTRGCRDAAQHVLNSVDETVDPCEDFYRFSCGNFLKNALAKNMHSWWKHLDDIKRNHLEQIITEDLENEDSLTKSFRYQREYYRACMDTRALDEDQDRTFLKAIKEITGGWPLSQGYTDDQIDWPEAMVRASERGFVFNFFFDVVVHIHENNLSEKLYLEIRLPPADNFDGDFWQDRNLQEIVRMAEHWGPPIPRASREREAQITIDFAWALYKLVRETHEEIEDIPLEDKKTTIGKLKYEPFFKLHWLEFLKKITGLEHLTEDDTVIFNVGPDYFQNFYYLIPKTNFEGVAESHYISKVITEEKRRHIKEIIKNIKGELALKLQTTRWMDEKTKELANEFLKNMTEVIGGTDIALDEKEFEKSFGYDKLELYTGNLIETSQQLSKFHWDLYMKNVGSKTSQYFEKEYNYPHVNVNAYYIEFLNTLFLAASILYPPIYDANRPEYMNYGSLGSIIGHELTHAFTKPEEGYGSKSAKTDDDFWSDQTYRNYYNEKKCLIEEYENYALEVKDEKISNGSFTLAENVADFTGVNLAYLAYQKWVERNGPEDQLPDLKYTPNQLFWIMASTYLCTEPKMEDPEMSGIGHAMASFRVNGPIRNSPFFGKDFGCPVGSKMNPKNKCRLFV